MVSTGLLFAGIIVGLFASMVFGALATLVTGGLFVVPVALAARTARRRLAGR